MGKKIKMVFKHKVTGVKVESYIEASGNVEKDQKAKDELIQVWEKDGKWENVTSN